MIQYQLLMYWVQEYSIQTTSVPAPYMRIPLHYQYITRKGINSLRPRQNGGHFADDIFKCIFLDENVWILIKFSLNFVSKGPINNIPVLVPIMAWRRPGDKPLSEPMMVSLPTRICVTRPQWVNSFSPGWYASNFKCAIFQHIPMIEILSISCETAPILMPVDLTDDKSTLVQVMATSRYLSQFLPRSLSPYGVTRPQWVMVSSYRHQHIHSENGKT